VPHFFGVPVKKSRRKIINPALWLAPVAQRDLLFPFYRHPCIDGNPRTGVINAYQQIATALEAVVHAIKG
jgi:hypothetical protein